MTSVKITKENLDEKTLTNREVIELLEKLSLEVDRSSFSSVLDKIEDLTGNRDFPFKTKIMDFLKDNSTEESRETRRLLDKALEKSANEALKSKKKMTLSPILL